MAIVSAVKIIGKKQPKKEKNMNLSVRLKKKKKKCGCSHFISAPIYVKKEFFLKKSGTKNASKDSSKGS